MLLSTRGLNEGGGGNCGPSDIWSIMFKMFHCLGREAAVDVLEELYTNNSLKQFNHRENAFYLIFR